MSQEIINKAKNWLSADNLDDKTRNKIQEMLNNKDHSELEESFYKDLEFGTGGLRGIMGIGSNRINKYTVGKATQGLANYLNETYPEGKVSVAVAHDSRNDSDTFAHICADVFSANGIKVYLFEGLRPTPELSFAIRELGCKSGVVLTASHNPKEYNGYKAYWADGAQVTPPHDKNIIERVNHIQSLDDIKFDRNPSLVETLGESMDNKYLDMICGLSLSPEEIKSQHDYPIVYSPIHGTGTKLVPEVLKRMGFTNVMSVEEQSEPDGNFPTVVYPNPEEGEALKMAIEKAEKENAELIMATDPDADRVGIAVRDLSGKFVLLNGNQTGALLIHYLLSQWTNNDKLNGKQYVVKTIVTTELIRSIANHYQVNCYDTLTGFKFIAMLIKELEGKEEFIGGGEESYGYLIGDQVRDKDAIASCAIIAEMGAFYKANGFSMFEKLLDIYEEHGFYMETLVSITKKGKKGAEDIQKMMSEFRSNTPKNLGGSPVIRLLDYEAGESKDLVMGNTEKLNYPTSNVLQFITEDGSKISARPSGTEPKIKFYMGVQIAGFKKEEYERYFKSALEKCSKIQSDLGL